MRRALLPLVRPAFTLERLADLRDRALEAGFLRGLVALTGAVLLRLEFTLFFVLCLVRVTCAIVLQGTINKNFMTYLLE